MWKKVASHLHALSMFGQLELLSIPKELKQWRKKKKNVQIQELISEETAAI